MENKVERVCPWWMGYLLLFPFRKIGQNPNKILSSYIKKGMTILDYGSAMGYFSLPMAKMTGEKGIVYCVDIQQKMLDSLQKRAERAGVGHIIKPQLINNDYNYNDLLEKVDFALLFAVAHEVPDKVKLFMNLYSVIKPGGKLFFAEPKGHVSSEAFNNSINIARMAGFSLTDEKPMPDGLCRVLVK